MKRAIFCSLAGLALLATILGCGKPTQVAPAEATLTITADPLRIEVFGTSILTIIARKSDGTPVNEGTEILLTTTLGSVDRVVLVDDRGVATAELTGDGTIGMANVEASSGAAAAVTVDIQIGALPATLFLSANPSTLSKEVQDQGATIKLSATVLDDLGAGIKSALVTFTSPRGVLESGGAPVETGKRGIAKDRLSVTPSDLAGVTDGFFDVTASTVGDGGELIEDIVEITVSGFAFSIFLQPIPTSIPESGGIIDLVATVLDDEGEPAVDAVVVFSSQVGSLPGGARRTDFDGVARDQLVLSAGDLDIAGTTFTVTADVPGAGGVLVSDTATITIQRGAPTAIISDISKTVPITTDVNCDDTRLTFISASAGDSPIDLTWDFGDGTTASDTQIGATADFVHDYGTKNGTFTVKLTASNNLGFDDAEVTIDLATFFASCP
jgi:hypothetical protein